MSIDSVHIEGDMLHHTAVCNGRQLDDRVKWHLQVGQFPWKSTSHCQNLIVTDKDFHTIWWKEETVSNCYEMVSFRAGNSSTLSQYVYIKFIGVANHFISK